MKVLVIYSRDGREKVETLRKEIADKYGSSTVLRMSSVDRKKSFIRHSWHRDAKKMMKCADIIVYYVSKCSRYNENVNWEIKQALAYNKYLVCLKSADCDYDILNDCLYKTDSQSKEKYCLAEILESKEKLFKIIDDYTSGDYAKLFNKDMAYDILLDQYKLFSNTAENLVNRRQNANSFYISANTAIITIGGTIFALGSDADLIWKLIVVLSLTIPGVLLNISWRNILQAYYINNQAKMRILSLIEKKLSVSLYDAEWKVMKSKISKHKYVSFTDSEKALPKVFVLFYIGVAIACVIGLLLIYLKGNTIIPEAINSTNL